MSSKRATFTYRDYLQKEFASRSGRNPHYSLRAFARDLEMAPSKLSEILRSKCGLSAGMAKAIAKRLRLNETEAQHFVALVEAEHSRSAIRRAEAKGRAKNYQAALGYGEIDLERFKIISDWMHFAILEMMGLAAFRSDVKWIAKRLGVTPSAAREAIDRLLQFQLIAENAAGQWVRTVGDLATPDRVPSRAKRDYHAQVLRKAIEAVDAIDPSERDFSSMTLSFASEQLEEARAALRDFRREFTNRFQKKNPRDRVYSLSVQFFPLDIKSVELTETER